MNKVIHQSWRDLAATRPGERCDMVAVSFTGTFTEGSHEGTVFTGWIHYDVAATPTESHASFAIYEQWPSPIVTVAVGGQIMTAEGAAVYDSVFDGREGHFDFVNMYGTGPFEQVEDFAFFEVFFSDEQASALDGTKMPTAEQLRRLPVKYVSFGTNAPGNVLSRGVFTLSEAR